MSGDSLLGQPGGAPETVVEQRRLRPVRFPAGIRSAPAPSARPSGPLVARKVRGWDQEPRREPMRRCSAMNPKSRTPMAMRVHQELRVPSKLRMVLMTPRTSTPSRVPTT